MTTKNHTKVIGSKIKFETNTLAPKYVRQDGYYLPKKQVDPKHVSRVLTHFTAVTNVMLGGVLDVADSYMIDAIEALKKRKMFRFNVKFRANLAREKFEKIRQMLYLNVKGREQLYMDLLDQIQDDVKSDIQKLYWPIRQVLDKHNVKDSDLKAQIEVVWMTLHLACRLYAAIVEGSNIMSGINTNEFYASHNPQAIFSQWEILCEEVCRYSREINEAISTDKNIGLAFDILLQRLIDPNYVEARCIAVMEQHPEFDKEANMVKAEQEMKTLGENLVKAENQLNKSKTIKKFTFKV